MLYTSDEDITARLATYDESYFVASVEGLDWDKIALVVRRVPFASLVCTNM